MAQMIHVTDNEWELAVPLGRSNDLLNVETLASIFECDPSALRENMHQHV